ncbi:uncharacterized protein LOC116117120 [Pistacia vera]|uniref:uncharacterized protein LOC116117120 n=1 Tax=Pistacia vera TaxID=55513 RepID=UPI0012632EF2|nr:uncharacterized protein LOC116117120 [Pistacia vera]
MTTSFQHLSKDVHGKDVAGGRQGDKRPAGRGRKAEQSLESVEAERTQAFEAANRYLSQKDAALRTVDFQKMELNRRAEEVKELQRTIARLSKEVGEKDQELQATFSRAQQAEQDRQALEAELQESQDKIASLTEEMQNQSEELEEKAADWAIGSIYSLRAKNPDLDMSDLPEGW